MLHILVVQEGQQPLVLQMQYVQQNLHMLVVNVNSKRLVMLLQKLLPTHKLKLIVKLLV